MYSTVPEKVEGKNKIKMTLAKTLNNKRQFINSLKAQFASILKSAKNCQRETDLFNKTFIVHYFYCWQFVNFPN